MLWMLWLLCCGVALNFSGSIFGAFLVPVLVVTGIVLIIISDFKLLGISRHDQGEVVWEQSDRSITFLAPPPFFIFLLYHNKFLSRSEVQFILLFGVKFENCLYNHAVIIPLLCQPMRSLLCIFLLVVLNIPVLFDRRRGGLCRRWRG